jgi:hypothetical protein
MPPNLPRTGVLDKNYTDRSNRSWIFRTCGTPTALSGGKSLFRRCGMFGYDYVLSIEHEGTA